MLLLLCPQLMLRRPLPPLPECSAYSGSSHQCCQRHHRCKNHVQASICRAKSRILGTECTAQVHARKTGGGAEGQGGVCRRVVDQPASSSSHANAKVSVSSSHPKPGTRSSTLACAGPSPSCKSKAGRQPRAHRFCKWAANGAWHQLSGMLPTRPVPSSDLKIQSATPASNNALLISTERRGRGQAPLRMALAQQSTP